MNNVTSTKEMKNQMYVHRSWLPQTCYLPVIARVKLCGLMMNNVKLHYLNHVLYWNQLDCKEPDWWWAMSNSTPPPLFKSYAFCEVTPGILKLVSRGFQIEQSYHNDIDQITAGLKLKVSRQRSGKSGDIDLRSTHLATPVHRGELKTVTSRTSCKILIFLSS